MDMPLRHGDVGTRQVSQLLNQPIQILRPSDWGMSDQLTGA